jgi:hypothetical protein
MCRWQTFVGQVFSEFVLAIAIDTQSIVRRIMVPGGGEGAIAASRDGRYIYTSILREQSGEPPIYYYQRHVRVPSR